MKGFPNQVADLGKVANAVRVAAELLDSGQNVRDDDIFGEALVRAGVAGRGRPPLPVNEYLAKQRLKPVGGQSFRTTARGIRELVRAMGLAEEIGGVFKLTPLGRQAADRPKAPIIGAEREFWRTVIVQIVHGDDLGISHPYQVLLRLVAAKPGITRAKCALALEARDDSPKELARIAALSDEHENVIREMIGATPANWDNAKKVLPSFAEQLGDVIKSANGSFRIANAPGAALAINSVGTAGVAFPAQQIAPMEGQSHARSVTPDTIGKAGTTEGDEVTTAVGIDAAAMLATNKQRAARLKTHNLLVQQIAATIAANDVALYEFPYDVLAVFDGKIGLLIEVKTLDGSAPDETVQVRNALSQLLYYEAFARRPRGVELEIRKLAYFDREPSPEHMAWLSEQGIATLFGVPSRKELRRFIY